MTGRARHRGERLHGLFGFDDGQPTAEPEPVEDNPLRRRCPTEHGGCGAQPIEPCTRPGRGGRRPIQGFHTARQPPEEATNA